MRQQAASEVTVSSALHGDSSGIGGVCDEELSAVWRAHGAEAWQSTARSCASTLRCILPCRVALIRAAAIEHDDVDEIAVLAVQIAHEIVERHCIVAHAAVAVV